MKRIAIIIGFTILFTLIYADFTESQIINSVGSDILFNGKDAAHFFDDNLYLTFYEKIGDELFVKLALSENGGNSFQFYQIDCMSWDPIYLEVEAPEIQISNNGIIIIIYEKQEELLSLYKARADYNDLDFSTDLIDTEVLGSHGLFYCNDEFILSYNKVNDQYEQKLLYCTAKERINDDFQSETLISFWGLDEFDGPVHSNDCICLKQGGGGDNNGWPTFFDYVSTSEYLVGNYYWDFIPSAPIEYIFLRDQEPEYQEKIPQIEILGDCSEIVQHGIRPFSPEADIVYIKLVGSSFVSMQGFIVVSDTLEIPVLSWYPADSTQVNMAIDQGYNWYEDADTLWINHVTVFDTIWTVGPSITLNNQSVYVESELWIEGVVSGNYSIACADTIYITSDICYAGTDIGESPCDPNNYNSTDYFGLASEMSILIKYKHRDPFLDNVIRNDNCDDVYLYGVYQALGVGGETYGEYAHFYDGQITPEYKHPHGSTPNFVGLSPYTLQETLYTFVDLHKYIYPIPDSLPENIIGFRLHGNDSPDMYPCGYPYESPEYIESIPNASNGDPDYEYQIPYGTEWPWYNPVWPESSHDITYERGTIYLYGSISQRRRGVIHNSGCNDLYHPPNNNGLWDIKHFIFDGDHRSVGYDRDYNFDTRLESVSPVNVTIPELNFVKKDYIVKKSIDDGNDFELVSIYNDDDYCVNKRWCFRNVSNEDYDIILTKDNYDKNCLFKIDQNSNEITPLYCIDLYDYKLNDAYLSSNNKLYLNLMKYGSNTNNQKLFVLNLETMEMSNEQVPQENISLSGFNLSNSGERVNVFYKSYLNGIYLNFAQSGQSWYAQELINNEISLDDIDQELSNISVQFDAGDSIFIFLNKVIDETNESKLYFIKGSLDGITPADEEILSKEYEIANYPNPFNPVTRIELYASEAISDADIRIYNIKGQLVQSFDLDDCSDDEKHGIYSVDWDGTNISGSKVGSGVYLLSVKINGTTERSTKMVLMK